MKMISVGELRVGDIGKAIRTVASEGSVISGTLTHVWSSRRTHAKTPNESVGTSITIAIDGDVRATYKIEDAPLDYIIQVEDDESPDSPEP